ncbi:MAG: molecular chaperone TorD family protein [Azonexus sp.]|jgi:TorA maturation chaperone TorD|nr:molecular chaperone TorD family protein [Azonexus sp.]
MAGRASLREQAERRCQGYWLLSRLFLEVPGPAFLAELKQMLSDPGAQGDPASSEIAALRAAVETGLANPDEAAVAFTRHLVIGDRDHGEPLPFEAHVLEGQLPGELTVMVAQETAAAGFADVAPEAPSPDHLGAELRFMALLCLQERDAWAHADDSAAVAALQKQLRFLSDHLAQWAPRYCLELAERAANNYVRSIARLCATTVSDDLVTLDEIRQWVAPPELATATAT